MTRKDYLTVTLNRKLLDELRSYHPPGRKLASIIHELIEYELSRSKNVPKPVYVPHLKMWISGT